MSEEKGESNNTDNHESAAQNQPDSQQFLEFANFVEYFDKFSNGLKETIQSSQSLITNASDLSYYVSYPAFKKFMQMQNEKVLKMMSGVVKHQLGKKPNLINSRLDNEDKLKILIDSNDAMIENLGIQLDIIEGLRKKTDIELKISNLLPTTRNIRTSWNKDVGMVLQKPTQKNRTFNLFNKKMVKPQANFADRVDNSQLPFLPKIRVKPNAIQPLPQIFTQLDTIKIGEDLFQQNPELIENPYAAEIDQLAISEEYFKEQEPQKPKSLEETPFEYIETSEQLQNMLRHLMDRSAVKEIGVDLEHHYQRSFLGFTCLMQISTRTKDFVIDTIQLRSEMHLLNAAFSDASLLKVLHGADFDIEWLQKDFGIYVVNMFDTGQASRILQYAHYSLAFLMQKFCAVQAQKQYQLADWRIRPLGDDLMKYAREDTHYLLFIYDNLRNELTRHQLQHQQRIDDVDACNKASLLAVYEKSKQLCRKVFKKPVFNSQAFMNLCSSNSHLSVNQMKALASLYEWRDKWARQADESCEYVLKKHQMLKIAELLPREIHGILALCNPVSSIVETNLHQIHELIMQARDFKAAAVLDNQAGEEIEPKFAIFTHLPLYDENNLIHCPHDNLSHSNADIAMEATNVNSSALSIEEMLIKPNDVQSLRHEIRSSSFGELFSTDDLMAMNKRRAKLTEKVNLIKGSMTNPFEKYMPLAARHIRQSQDIVVDDSLKWVLIRPSEVKSKAVVAQKIQQEVSKSVEAQYDVIPLRSQVKSERIDQNLKKKFKKARKDMTDAIIEYNRTNTTNRSALGGQQATGEPEEGEITASDAISSNLKMIAAQAKSIANRNENLPEYQYQKHDLNKMFTNSKAEQKRQNAKVYDPSSRVKNAKFGKVQKKHRVTNNLNRGGNNKMATFK